MRTLMRQATFSAAVYKTGMLIGIGRLLSQQTLLLLLLIALLYICIAYSWVANLTVPLGQIKVSVVSSMVGCVSQPMGKRVKVIWPCNTKLGPSGRGCFRELCTAVSCCKDRINP
jgi:hypothetical protein